uniref:RNA polymerase sigma factor n=1 Tax=uncultured Draconibacterium sp. TaxID=1573823 RepID=UPI0032172A90
MRDRDLCEKKIDILWQSFLDGDDKCFSVIYQQHVGRMLLYGKKLSTDQELLHDCIQEVFIDLFTKRTTLGKKIKNLKAYLFVALRNSILKKITINRKYETIDLAEEKQELNFNVEYSFQDVLIDKEISDEVHSSLKRAINSLPAKQKEIIYLKFEEEMEYPEISEILQISIESSRKLLYRALLTLRNRMNSVSFRVFFVAFLKKS